MATFWEIAAHSADHMFGFEGLILVLIASVPDICILFIFDLYRSSVTVSYEIGRRLTSACRPRHDAAERFLYMNVYITYLCSKQNETAMC